MIAEQTLQQFALRTGEALIVLRDGEIAACNLAAVALFGFAEPADLIGRGWVELSAPAQTDGRMLKDALPHLWRMIVEAGSINLQWLARRADGVPLPTEFNFTAITAHPPVQIVAIGRDISDRVKQEQQVALAERERIARDLHDSVTQTLFSASLIAQVIPRLWEQNQAEGQRQLEELHLLTRGALSEMRTLLLEMRPHALAKVPLTESLRHLVNAAIGRAGINIQLKVTGTIHLPVEARLAFYRIAQEALNNIIKHAKADSAAVGLARLADGAVELRVSDDGVGFMPYTVHGAHLGLKIMAERAHSIGAQLHLFSQPAQGTTISVIWREGGLLDD